MYGYSVRRFLILPRLLVYRVQSSTWLSKMQRPTMIALLIPAPGNSVRSRRGIGVTWLRTVSILMGMFWHSASGFIIPELLVEIDSYRSSNKFQPTIKREIMRAHYLQHVPFEGLGSIEPWLRSAGYEISSTRFFDQTALPELSEIDLLVVMGGPMSVNDEGEYPWLVQEKQYIRQVIDAGKHVLGICLGAQLIASAMGARVYPNRHREIGWFPIQGVPVPDGSIFCFPRSVQVFHWQGETFDLPPGAVRFASSEGCENQAFQLGQSVIGLQFHLETTPESAQEIVSHCRAELIPARYVQPETTILGVVPESYRTINNLMAEVLSSITGVGGQRM